MAVPGVGAEPKSPLDPPLALDANKRLGEGFEAWTH